MNYFTLFNLPETFDIDPGQLMARYHQLQRQWHPDRFATSPEPERLQALQQAALVNQGWQALRQPLIRAEYLLSLHGFDINNEQYTLHDTEFLMEQMSLREALEAIEQMADPEPALTALANRTETMIKQRSDQMRLALAEQHWSDAADRVRKLRFLTKLRSQIDALEDHLPD